MHDALRPRQSGPPAVRQTLLTILGEYVAPLGAPVAQDSLVKALVASGHKLEASRQAVRRSIDDGWLVARRSARRVHLQISDRLLSVLEAGYPRIFGLSAGAAWDGRWLLVVVRVPEVQRSARDRLRITLAWEGFGSLGGGLWISPHVERATALDGVAETTGTVPVCFRAELVDDADARELANRAWDLPDIARQYEAFLAAFEPVRGDGLESMFRAQTTLVDAWRRFPFVDPGLPPHMLPDDWPRARAESFFRHRHDQWASGAEAFFNSLGP